jgi:hypothetical protein
MKKLLPILSILFISALLISACNSKPTADPNAGKVLTYADTAGLADFQKWKVQNELADPAVYYRQGTEVSTTQPARKTTKSYSSVRKTSNTGGSLNSVSQYPAKNDRKKRLEQKSQRCGDRWWRRRDPGSSHQQE